MHWQEQRCVEALREAAAAADRKAASLVTAAAATEPVDPAAGWVGELLDAAAGRSRGIRADGGPTCGCDSSR